MQNKIAQMKEDNKSSFFHDVWEVTKLIPSGRVTSYGAMANYLGLKSSARMVGWALNGVPDREKVPAHRVLNRNGLLTGKMHFHPPELMQERLEKEGVEVKEDQVVDFKKLYWDPQIELI